MTLKESVKRIRKILETAERYWVESRKALTESDGTVNWTQVIGTVRNRLDLESIDLVIAGISPDIVCENADVERGKTEFNETEKAIQVIAIAELAKVDMGNAKSSLAYIKEKGGFAMIRRSILHSLDRVDERFNWDRLRRLFPGAMDRYISFLAESE